MAKGKGKINRGPHIKNADLIGKGTKLPVVKDAQGQREWVKSVNAGKQTPSPEVKQSKLAEAAKSQAAKLPPKPAVEKITPAVKPPSK